MIKNRFFWLLILFIFCILVIPQKKVRQLRNCAIALISPSKSKQVAFQGKELEKLQTENQLLHLQIERLRNWIFQDQVLDREKEELLALLAKSDDPFFRRRSHCLAKIIQQQLHALPARIIFRDPSPWSSSVWVDVGEKDNQILGYQVIAKNSPVVIGKTIVGVVEEVTEKKSHVRLITDRSLAPAVRAIRGGEQNRVLSEKLQELIKLLVQREGLYGAADVARALTAFQEHLNFDSKELYLAKGQLHGTAAPVGRVPNKTLRGVGFNYDFSDEEGPARNLRTGSYSGGQDPLIKVGDLLVTTGGDGIFPPDFLVGVVSKIFPLHEGGCFYDLEAEMLCPNLNTLGEVFILPPL